MVGELGHHVSGVYSSAVRAALLLLLLLRVAGVVDGAGVVGGTGEGAGRLICFVQWGV